MDERNKSSFTPEEEQRMKAKAAARAKQRAEQERIKEEKKKAQKKRMSKLATAGTITLIVIVCVSLVFIAARSLGNVTFTKIIDYIKDGFSNMEPGDGYPTEIGSGNVKDMTMLGETMVVVKNDEVSLLNRTAKETVGYTHSYSKPMTAINSGRMLVCDRVTGRYMITDHSELLHSEELQTETYACTLAKNGSYAFSLKTERAASVVAVYDSDFKKMFDFKCADEYVIGLSISPNGKNIALVGVGSKDACLYSKLYIINIKNNEVVNTIDFEGESLHSVFCSDNDTVIVLSENAYTVVNKNGEKEKVNFGYNTISRFVSDESGNFAIVLSKYGSIDSGTVALLDSKGKEIFSVELESKIECIDYDGSTVCISDSSNTVHTFNKRGKLIGKTKLDTATQDVTVSGKKCYALCFGTIVQLNIRTHID